VPIAPSAPQRLASLAIVLPCRNEAQNVERVVAEALRHGALAAARVEVIVVNDASLDDTGAKAEALAAQDSRVRVVHHSVNQGYGGALRSGFAATTAATVFYTDGDGQFDLAELSRLPALLASPSTVLAAYRLKRQDPALRRLMGWVWTRVVNLAFGLHSKDVDCAFKAFPGEFVRSLPLESRGALISAELLARSKAAGMEIVTTGVRHLPRQAGRPTGAHPRVILRALRELVVLRSRILAAGRKNDKARP
jgi:glycosyltransferase involved in cell wall biosynthesis